jgi:hypothetical protein
MDNWYGLLHQGLQQRISRIGNARRAGIGHQGHTVPFLQQGK